MADKLPGEDTLHWTGKPHRLTGILAVDGNEYAFMGKTSCALMEQCSVDVSALTTTYTFACAEGTLTVDFTTPMLPGDLMLLSRPISYVAFAWTGKPAVVTLTADEELCLNLKGESPVTGIVLDLPGLTAAKAGNTVQDPLNASGDDLRIDWGYLYMATAEAGAKALVSDTGAITVSAPITDTALFALAYDDVDSLMYFDRPVKAYWRRAGKTLEELLLPALAEYPRLKTRCDAFSANLRANAEAAGSEKYADIVTLAFRQVCGAHKLCLDDHNELIYVSKECFSNGCAATVDVSYPSIPMLLLYQPRLVAALMRPIFRYCESPVWPFDFAAHDCGQYPLLNGQVYGNNVESMQMPVEECGNMLIMMANYALAMGDASMAAAHWETLEQWVGYLLRCGADPENQLCTDDFAGHLAHNVNLSVKAIMGVAAFSILNGMLGMEEEARQYLCEARRMAKSWVKRAANPDGTYKLAFDRDGSTSMKYNMVWDKAWGTHVFPEGVLDKELSAYKTLSNKYGLPLDVRADYTKSDWLVWCASMTDCREDFDALIDPLWLAYHESSSRVPLSDWYDTKTAVHIEFRNRTVQGGLFMPMLLAAGTVKL